MQFEFGERETFKEICNYVQSSKKIPLGLEEKFRKLITKFPETKETTEVLKQLDQHVKDHELDEEDSDDEFVDDQGKRDWNSAFVTVCLALTALYALRIFDEVTISLENDAGRSPLAQKKEKEIRQGNKRDRS